MEINKKMIKALSADTRLYILKSLKERRKMPSELSKELKLAGSTVVEHLKKLEDAGLVEKQERGEKWIYYDLTENGRSLVQPKTSVQFILMLSLGILFLFCGLTNIRSYSTFQSLEKAATTAVAGASDSVAVTQQTNWITVLIIAVGLFLVIYSLYRIFKK